MVQMLRFNPLRSQRVGARCSANEDLDFSVKYGRLFNITTSERNRLPTIY